MYDEAEVFKELAPLLRVRPQLQQICRFGAQWSSQHEPEPEGWAPFHIVTFGACLLEVVGYESDAAFSRAYRRRFGTAPGADRKG